MDVRGCTGVNKKNGLPSSIRNQWCLVPGRIRYGRIPTDLVFNSEEGTLGTEVVLRIS